MARPGPRASAPGERTITDARDATEGATLTAEVCIVGGGTLALAGTVIGFGTIDGSVGGSASMAAVGAAGLSGSGDFAPAAGTTPQLGTGGTTPGVDADQVAVGGTGDLTNAGLQATAVNGLAFSSGDGHTAHDAGTRKAISPRCRSLGAAKSCVRPGRGRSSGTQRGRARGERHRRCGRRRTGR